MNAIQVSTRMLLGYLLLFLSSSAHAVTTSIWVGLGGGACQTASLATALASASSATADTTIIRLVNNQSYNNLNLSALNRNLVIVGGIAACGSTIEDGSRTTIRGAPNGGSVFLIATAGNFRTITLRALDVRDGSGGGDDTGGGLQIGGNLQVVLDNTRVFNSDASLGGGISIVGGISRPQLTLSNGTYVGFGAGLGNTADTGAGIYCQHGLIAMDDASIVFNTATGNGGGLYLDDCLLYSQGSNDTENGIQQNNAGSGAGIFAINASTVTFGIGGGRTTFASNDAEEFGGAIFLSGPDTTAYLRASWLSSNTAGLFGGGVFSTSGALFTLDRGEAPENCNFFPCSALFSNRAGTSGGSAFAYLGGVVQLRGVEVRNNGVPSDGATLHALGPGSRLELREVLVRQLNGEGMLLGSGAEGYIYGSTFVNNAFSSDIRLADSGNTLDVQDSIFWDAPAAVLSGAGNGMVTGINNNAHDISALPDSVAVDPGFVDAASGNYRLRGDSPNVDTRTPPPSPYGVDIEGNPRRFNLYPDNGGIQDRGAFELGDHIFDDGFETLQIE